MNAASSTDAPDAKLFARLRAAWMELDPEPDDFVDRMVAAVAAADLHREYELLTLVEQTEFAPTRSAAVPREVDTRTLQFSDGTMTVLLRVSVTAGGRHRVDGWADGAPLVARLNQGDNGWSTQPVEGRFAFDELASGVTTLRLVTRARGDAGGLSEFATVPFEI